MVVNDYAGSLIPRGALSSFASKLRSYTKADRAAGLARHASLQSRRVFHFSARIMPTFPACKKNYIRL